MVEAGESRAIYARPERSRRERQSKLRFSRLTQTFKVCAVGVVYLVFSLVCVPGIIAAPTVYERYGSFFEQFAALCGAIALYAATEANAARAVAFGRVARLGLGVCTFSFALSQIIHLRVTADLVREQQPGERGRPRWIPPNQMFWAVLTTIAFALAGIAILINRQARLAIRLMTLMLALFGVLVWIPLLIAHQSRIGTGPNSA
jgi:hypothetical protein